MQRTLATLLVSLTLSCPGYTQDNTGDAAVAVFERFLTAMTNADIDTVTSLFAEDALFWGTGSQSLVTTPAGVLAYFTPVGRNEPGATLARARNVETRVLADDLVMISGMWEVVPRRQDGGTPLRVSMLMQKRDDQWLIIQFHNSRVPE
jgi:uncharacterized protein (TIGR02246 family)